MKCPYCGSKLTRTGYSFPFPQLRCNSCIERNDMKKRIAKLEKQVNHANKGTKP